MAWPIEQQGRKFTAGVALFDADGALMARGRQIWIARGAPKP
jgi:acyl-CoA thioesterase